MTPQTRTKKIRNAIEPVLEKYGLASPFEVGEFVTDIVDAMLPLMVKEMPTTDETESKIKAIDDMIKHVEQVLNVQIDYGKKKWEAAIKYLIKVKEKDWDIAVMWIHLNSDELKFKKDIPSIGTIMKDPEDVVKTWMPIAHAVKTDTTHSEVDKGGGVYV
jgi:hypothetical protein